MIQTINGGVSAAPNALPLVAMPSASPRSSGAIQLATTRL